MQGSPIDGLVQDQYSLMQRGVASSEVRELFFKLIDYMAVDAADALLAAMATAVSVATSDGEALWLMLVGAPSGGKTETLRTLSGVADAQLTDVTVAGLLAQHPPGKSGKVPPLTGLLAELGDGCNALVTIADLSSLLGRAGSASSGPGQTAVFDALRSIYDGEYQRRLARVAMSWTGQVTFVAAATPEIDRTSVHANALGPRWVYFRLEPLTDEQRDTVFDMTLLRTDVAAHRAEAAELVRKIVLEARRRLPEVALSPGTTALVKAAVMIASFGRATITRDFGHNIDGVPTWEEPGRLTYQLLRLATCLTALGIGDSAVQRITGHAAWSCIPAHRARALAVLAVDPWMTTNAVSIAADLAATRTRGSGRHSQGR